MIRTEYSYRCLPLICLYLRETQISIRYKICTLSSLNNEFKFQYFNLKQLEDILLILTYRFYQSTTLKSPISNLTKIIFHKKEELQKISKFETLYKTLENHGQESILKELGIGSTSNLKFGTLRVLKRFFHTHATVVIYLINQVFSHSKFFIQYIY